MNLSLRIADPAGNITIFVMNEVPADQYASIAGKLLEIKEFRAEQVAFALAPRTGAAGRMQMMGGEFCGNATRSYGYLLSCLSEDRPSKVITEVSGSDKPLEVVIDHANGTCETEMPLPAAIRKIEFANEAFDAVCFDGIVHIIVNGNARSAEFVDALFTKISNEIPADAYGIMFLSGDEMIPVVYVCETNSLIWESSCGSGSMAVAVYRALASNADGSYRYDLAQPGGLITATAVVENGTVISCRMGGPVSFSEEIFVEIED